MKDLTVPSLDKDDASGMRVRLIRPAADKRGSFHTFRMTRRPDLSRHVQLGSPSSPPSDECSILISRYVCYVVAPWAANDPSTLCPNLFEGIVASRIGVDPVLDASVVYTIDSRVAFLTQDLRNTNRARRSNNTVLKLLQEAIAKNVDQPQHMLILSVALLVQAEVRGF